MYQKKPPWFSQCHLCCSCCAGSCCISRGRFTLKHLPALKALLSLRPWIQHAAVPRGPSLRLPDYPRRCLQLISSAGGICTSRFGPLVSQIVPQGVCASGSFADARVPFVSPPGPCPPPCQNSTLLNRRSSCSQSGSAAVSEEGTSTSAETSHGLPFIQQNHTDSNDPTH